ncbi:putative multicopper oxidase [Rosellinia necatrix]|uniref:Putative multicopper oxidase n=1 Tax=Rosellinia necatrix TaxID=77044 RepID=A0A1W2TX81_ROSNE|nr:putative multicopper oxidase [Rosellinia necatrix]
MMPSIFTLAALLSTSIVSIAALQARVHDDTFTPDAVLSVTRQTISVAGIERYTTLINNSLPAPVLRIPEDQVIWIRVYNDMNDANVTMHWHGLTEAAYPFSDGSPLASQWPIPPQHFFDYELKTANGTAGTYFYHAHVGFEAATASGPLIVEGAEPPPYAYDDERIVYIQELFNETDDEVAAGLVATPLRWPGEPQSWLINGKGISNYGVVDPSTATVGVIDVKPQTTYLFRFVAGTALSLASLAFENHTGLEIVEVDSHYTKPLAVDFLQIAPGQRFSTLLTTQTCAELAALGKLDFYMQIESRERRAVVTNYALLRYDGSSCNGTLHAATDHPASTTANPATAPLQLPPTVNGYLDYELQPLEPNDFPTAAEVTRRVVINVQQVVDRWYVWEDNGVRWTENAADPLAHTTPAKPYLVALYLNETGYLPDYDAGVANGGLDPRTGAYPARLGEVLEIVLQNVGARTLDGSAGGGLDTHPWHMHGRHYYDIGAGEGVFDADAAEAKLAGTTPVQRDTTLLYRYANTTAPDEVHAWRAWRVRVLDAGVWMVHCHILQHMIQGMQVPFVFGDTADIIRVGVPEVEGYLTFGGDVYGNSSHAPTVVHFSELD